MYPLRTFLHVLESDGVILTVRDYDRIQRVLGCSGEWTLARLRHVLLVLLAKDENQRELIGRRFDDFFDVNVTGPATQEVELSYIRAELLAFHQDRSASSARPFQPISRPKPPVTAAPDPRRRQNLVLLLILFGLFVGIVAGWKLFKPPKPQLQVSPLKPVMSAFPEEEEPVDVIVRNSGGGSLTVGEIDPLPRNSFFSIKTNTCEKNGAVLQENGQCRIQIVFCPKHHSKDKYKATMTVPSDAGTRVVELTGHCNPTVEETEDRADIDKLPTLKVAPRGIKIQELKKTTAAGSDTWWLAAVLSLFFLALTLIFGWYLTKARKPPDDRKPHWDAGKPRHFPLETIGGEPASRLDDETLTHLADSMGYFSSERTGSRPDIDASVLATVENSGIPQLIFHRGKELRHLIILEEGLAFRQSGSNVWPFYLQPPALPLAFVLPRRYWPNCAGGFVNGILQKRILLRMVPVSQQTFQACRRRRRCCSLSCRNLKKVGPGPSRKNRNWLTARPSWPGKGSTGGSN